MTLQYWTSIGNSVKPGSAKQTPAPAVNVTYSTVSDTIVNISPFYIRGDEAATRKSWS